MDRRECCALSALPGPRLDPYPFILLNLAFSTQASYSAPLILLAQNRQDDRDRVQAQQDRQRAERNLADTEYLTREIASLRLSIQEVATRDFLRSEIRDLLDDLREDIRAEVREEMREELRGEIQAELDEIGLHPEAFDEAAPSAEKAEE